MISLHNIYTKSFSVTIKLLHGNFLKVTASRWNVTDMEMLPKTFKIKIYKATNTHHFDSSFSIVQSFVN
jgi:hypothetical protein